MKIIDLLNRIANNEELPKKIKYYDIVYRLNESNEYISNGNLSTFMMNVYEVNLNDEIEVLEDEEINIQEMKEYKTEYTERCIDIEVREKINEIIRAVKQLDNKINKEYCQNCGVELNAKNRALKNMCNECKYGLDR